MIPHRRAEAPDAKEPIGSLNGRCVIVSVSEIGLAKSYRAKTLVVSPDRSRLQ
jgi:hypothetical protein